MLVYASLCPLSASHKPQAHSLGRHSTHHESLTVDMSLVELTIAMVGMLRLYASLMATAAAAAAAAADQKNRDECRSVPTPMSGRRSSRPCCTDKAWRLCRVCANIKNERAGHRRNTAQSHSTQAHSTQPTAQAVTDWLSHRTHLHS
jgi:hypothetical protein